MESSEQILVLAGRLADVNFLLASFFNWCPDYLNIVNNSFIVCNLQCNKF